MKRTIYFIAALMAVILASCSKESVVSSDVNDPDGSNVIGFKTYSGVITKGTSVENTAGFKTAFAKSGFGVAAFVDGDTFDAPYLSR